MGGKGEKVKKISKIRFVFCVVYCIGLFIVCGSYPAVFAYIPEYVGGTLVEVSTSTSIQSVMMAVGGVVAATCYKRLGIKLSMILSGVAALVYAVLLGLMPSVLFCHVAFAVLGAVWGIGGIACVGNLLGRLFGSESGKYMPICVGTGMLTSGVAQGVAGFLFENFGIKLVFLIECGVGAVIMLIMALLISVPKEETAVEEQSVGGQADESTAKKPNVYVNPAVWLFWIGTIVVTIALAPILTYVTAYLPECGMTVSTAATVMSMLGIGNGIFNLLICGKLMQKMNIKAFVLFESVCFVGAAGMFLVYGQFQSVIVIAAIVLLYAVGCSASSLFLIASPVIFDMETSAQVMTKGTTCQAIGNMVAPILVALFVTSYGYASAYVVAVVGAAIALVLHYLAVCMAKKSA